MVGFYVFYVFDGCTLPAEGKSAEMIGQELRRAAEEGWIVPFLSASSIQSAWVLTEIQNAMQLGAKFVPVLLEKVTLPPRLATLQTFDAYARPATGPADLASLLLNRTRNRA